MDWCTTLRHWLLQLLVRFAQKVACEVCCSDEEVWQLLFWCSCISTEVVLCATGAIAFPQKWLEQGSNTSQSQRRARPQNIGCVANVRAGDLSAISRAGRHARQRKQCRFIAVRSFRLLVLDSGLLLTFVFDLIAVSSCAVCL